MVALPAKFPASRHYRVRTAERRLRSEIEDFVLRWGEVWRAASAEHFTIVERELPPELRGSALASRARDWIVVVSQDGTLLTCYRHRNAVRFLQRKSGRPRRRRCRGGR